MAGDFPWMWLGVQLIVLGAVGGAGVWIARRFGAPALVGGVLAGLLVGPTFLGRAAPDVYERIFSGGEKAVSPLQQFLDDRADARRALEATGVTDVALDEFDAETERRRAEYESFYVHGTGSNDPVGVAIAMLAAPLLLLCGGGRFEGRLLKKAAPTAVGALLGPACIAAPIGFWLTGLQRLEGAVYEPRIWVIGMILGCVASSLFARKDLIKTIQPVEYADPAASPGTRAAHATALAAWWTIVILAFVIWWRGGAAGDVLASAFIIELLICGAAGIVMALQLPGCCGAWRGRIEACAAALLFALVGSRVDLIGDFDWLIALVVLLLVGDVRSLCIAAAERWFERRGWLDGFRIGTVIVSGSATALLIIGALKWAGLIEAKLFTALVIAHVLTAWFAAPALRLINRLEADLEAPAD